MKIAIVAGGSTAERGGTLGSAEQLRLAGTEAGCEVHVVPLPDDRRTGSEWLGQLHRFDILYPTVAGLESTFEFLELPYVGSDATAAILCADKGLFNDFLMRRSFRRTPYVRSTVSDALADIEQTDLQFPLFVKPARLGASYGITRVQSPAELLDAIWRAGAHDHWLVIEEAMPAPFREVEVAGLRGDQLHLSLPGIIEHGGEVGWRDSASKYSVDTEIRTLPAADPLTKQAHGLTEELCYRSGVTGAFRVDFFLSADGELFVSEMNCVPGHGVASTFPRLFEASGVDRSDQFALAVGGPLGAAGSTGGIIRF